MCPVPAQMAELVDALVSGTSGESRGGSSPLLGTTAPVHGRFFTGGGVGSLAWQCPYEHATAISDPRDFPEHAGRLPFLRHSLQCVVNGALMIRFAAAIDLAIMSSVGPEEQTR